MSKHALTKKQQRELGRSFYDCISYLTMGAVKEVRIRLGYNFTMLTHIKFTAYIDEEGNFTIKRNA